MKETALQKLFPLLEQQTSKRNKLVYAITDLVQRVEKL